MAFDTQYPNRKDWRRPYVRTAERVDRTCRCHGTCAYCALGRQHAAQRREPVDVDEQLNQYRLAVEDATAAEIAAHDRMFDDQRYSCTDEDNVSYTLPQWVLD